MIRRRRTSSGSRSSRAAPELAVELLEVVQVHGGDQAAPVAEVGVDERAGHPAGVGHLLEADLARVAARGTRRRPPRRAGRAG